VSLPLLSEYVDRLPNGLDSYPNVTAKGSILSRLVDAYRGVAPEGMPAPLTAHFVRPPAPNEWVPEVHLVALTTSVVDTLFRDQPPAAFERWALQENKQLLRGPLYRILFSVLSPERILVGLEKRWSAFHRGTTFEQIDVGPSMAIVRFRYPPYLLSPQTLTTRSTAIRAAVETAGAKLVTVDAREESPRSTVFEVRWR
jgi:hypothetical protein